MKQTNTKEFSILSRLEEVEVLDPLTTKKVLGGWYEDDWDSDWARDRCGCDRSDADSGDADSGDDYSSVDYSSMDMGWDPDDYSSSDFGSGDNNGSADGGYSGYEGISGPGDGIDFNNPDTNIDFDSTMNSNFQDTLKSLLENNSVIKELLSNFLNGGNVQLTFSTAPLDTSEEKYEAMVTKHGSVTEPNDLANPHIYIIINENSINNEGEYQLDMSGKDNMGYDRDVISGGMEELVVSLAHEAFHAKIASDMANALANAPKEDGKTTPSASAFMTQMQSDGIPQEVIDAYFIKEPVDPTEPDGVYNLKPNPNKEDLIHDYFEENFTETLNRAFEKYCNDLEAGHSMGGPKEDPTDSADSP